MKFIYNYNDINKYLNNLKYYINQILTKTIQQNHSIINICGIKNNINYNYNQINILYIISIYNNIITIHSFLFLLLTIV